MERRHHKRVPELLFLKKAATFSLLFSFTFSPLLAAAQETQLSPAEDIDTSPTQVIEVEVQDDEPETSLEVEAETYPDQAEAEQPTDTEIGEALEVPEAMAMSGGSTVSDVGTSFINNETTRSTAPDVDTETGSLKYSYALAIPPGRNGMEPDLQLQYSSNHTDNSGVFGYGWSASIPRISRVNKYGVDRLYSDDVFTSSLDGELVRVGTTTTYRPRVENGSFREYTFASSTWTVLEKNGQTMSFGSTSATQQNDTASSTRVYAWYLEEARDLNDNYVEYSYYKDAGQIYPNTISYTGSGTTDGPFLIEFTRESRADNLVSYDMGFVATTTYRISNVKASVDGVWVFSYDLGYSAGHNGSRSLLSSVTKKGKDEVSGVEVTLPATLFSYETYGVGDKHWDEDSSIDVPVNIIHSIGQADDGARFVDINGDGRPDIIRSFGYDPYPSNPGPYSIAKEVFLHTGDGWATSTDWTIPAPENGRFGFSTAGFFYGPEGSGSASGVDLGARFADVNGDGYTDILWAYHTESLSISGGYQYDYNIRDVYINNKVDGWATSTDWIIPNEIQFGSEATPGSGRVADVNGDGLPDLLAVACTPGGSVFLNNGAGWTQAASSTWSVPEPISCGTRDLGVQLSDINGDGLIDIVRSDVVEDDDEPDYPGTSKVYLNNGAGWTQATGWTIPVAFAFNGINSPFNHSLSARLSDVNGDGLPDIIRSSTASSYYQDGSGVYINTGKGWSQDSNWTIPSYFKFTKTNSGKTYQRDSGFAEMDFDGDNLIDLVKSGIINSPSPYDYYPHEEGVFLHEGKVPDLLSSIEYPEGGEVDFVYEQSSRYKDGSTYLNPNLSSNLNTVTEVTYDNGVTDSYIYSYIYGGGENYFASSTERKFAGFATSTATDASGNVTLTYIHQGNGTQSELGELNDSYEKIGKPYLIETQDDSENVFARTINKWVSTTTEPGSHFVSNQSVVVQHYDGDEDHRDTATEWVYDSVGNISQTTEWGEVIATTTSGSFSDVGSDKRTYLYDYTTASTSKPTNFLKEVEVLDQENERVRFSEFYYDNLGYGLSDNGNLTKQRNWSADDIYSETLRTYDGLGMVVTEEGSRFATTTNTYDAKNLYPALVLNALGHTASTTYDYSLGKPRIVTNANGHSFETVYDGFDRALEKLGPDPVTGATVTLETNSYTDTRNNVSTHTVSQVTASTSVETLKFYDGFGRKIQERISAEADDTYVVRDWIYGVNGKVSQESLPYFDEGDNDSDPTSENSLLIEYEYDPLGRVLSLENAVGTTETTYDQWTQTVVDALERSKDFGYDAYGHLVSVNEYIASSTYNTVYTWDHNDRLLSITDALGNVRSFTYDGLGRRLSAEDLHAPADGTYGVWSYAYDKTDNVTSITDPKGQVVEKTYDLLSRQLTENYLGETGTEVTYAYDSCTYGVGYLCFATSTDAVASYTYSPNGKIASETKNIDGDEYRTEYVYNLLGGTSQLEYPDGSTVLYTYNNGGQIESVQQKEDGGEYEFIVTDIDYGPHGLVTYQETANRTFTTNMYDEESLYRLSRKIVQTLPLDSGSEGLMSFSGNSEGEDAEPSFLIEDLLKGGENYVETRSGENLTTGTTTVATSSPQKFVSEEVELKLQEENALSATSSPASSRLKTLSADSEELKLKAPSKLHLGRTSADGIVKYAYQTDVRVDTLPISKKTLQVAKDSGLSVGSEIVEKRTKYARTFSTNNASMHITEILSGDPKYYKDPDGVWWLADYAETTVESYELQLRQESKVKSDVPKKISFAQILDELFTVKRAYASTGVFYPDANPEVNTVDGELYKDNSTNWNTVRNASASNWGSDSNTGLGVVDQVGNGNGSNYMGIRRSFILFDTSSIDDATAIQSASLDLYITDVNAAGSEKRMYVVSSNPASNTSLAYGDYDQIGSTSFGVTDGTYTLNTYESIPLNSSGLSHISKTGITKLGLRSYNDFNNVTPTNSNELAIYASASEYAGTSQDPKLVVVYNVQPSIATGLRAQQKISPQEVSEIEPTFSAIFVDPDVTDTASAYQIQVSTSPTDWSVPVWDSGSQAFSDPVLNGHRTDDIEYGGTQLTPGVEYFWRMKFWDAYGSTGSWSTTTVSFTLAEIPPPLMDNLYGYDAVGNIVSITDIRDQENPVANLYEYDSLDRLISVATTSASINFVDGLVTVQPEATIGKDTYYGTVYVTGGAPSADVFRIGGWGDNYYSYIQFPLDSVQDDDEILSAHLHLFQENANSGNEAKLERITESWSEAGVTNSSNPASTDLGMSWQSIPNNDWLIMDVTQLVKDWKSGTHSNHGVKIFGRYNGGDQVKIFRSSDHANSDFHPKLVVTGTHDASNIPDIAFSTSTSMIESYSYDALGNILSKSGQGTYVYGAAGYANPHAVTSIASTSLSYDQNGNLTGLGLDTYFWDYRNRTIGSTVGATSTTYGYDYSDSRVFKTTGAVSTVYPNHLFSIEDSEVSKNIYVDNNLIGTIYGTGSTTASTTYTHADHLGSTRFVTDETGNLSQSTEYDSFGSEASNTLLDGVTQAKQYIGQTYDAESSLSYLNARYYDGSRGRFLSQDPVFLAIGVDPRTDSFLRNPQVQNSYSYAMNNPITHKDPEGEEPVTISTVAGVTLILSWAGIASFGLQQRIGEYEVETMKSYPSIYTKEEVANAQAELDKAETAQAASMVLGAVSSTAGAILDAGGLLADFGTKVLDIKFPKFNEREGNKKGADLKTEVSRPSNNSKQSFTKQDSNPKRVNSQGR